MISSPAPVQRTLSLDLKNGRPLCNLGAAMAWLGMREDLVKEMWERGDLAFAFNIAGPDAQKLEPRIAISSIASYNLGYRAPLGYRHRDTDPEIDTFLASLWPHSRPTLRLSEVYDALCCSSQHALDLLRAGCFHPTTPLLVWSPNPKAAQRVSPIVHRASVLEFLKSRRLP